MRNEKIKKMVGIAFLVALVVVLQLMGSFIRIGTVEFALVLVPIVVGSAIYGPIAGVILGATFSIVTLLQPGTYGFYAMSVVGTVITVMAKGILSGWLSGLTYKALEKKSPILAAYASAIVCPVVNTGVFFLGCMIFFYEPLSAVNENVLLFVLTAYIGWNFVAELIANILCGPVIVRLLKIFKKNYK